MIKNLTKDNRAAFQQALRHIAKHKFLHHLSKVDKLTTTKLLNFGLTKRDIVLLVNQGYLERHWHPSGAVCYYRVVLPKEIEGNS